MNRKWQKQKKLWMFSANQQKILLCIAPGYFNDLVQFLYNGSVTPKKFKAIHPNSPTTIT